MFKKAKKKKTKPVKDYPLPKIVDLISDVIDKIPPEIFERSPRKTIGIHLRHGEWVEVLAQLRRHPAVWEAHRKKVLNTPMGPIGS